MMKKQISIFLLSLLLFIYAISFILNLNEVKYDKEILNQIERKDFILNEYLNTSKSLLYTLNDTFKSNLEIFKKKSYTHPIFQELCFDSNSNVYYTKILLDKENEIYASINGLKSCLYQEDKVEIISTLYLNPIFKNSVKYIDDLLWIYYTSKNKFLYLAPTDIQTDEKFLNELYTKEFWTEAIEKNNPNKELIITSIYLDSANKGLMTTLSLPVYVKNKLKGVFSIDIGLDTIQKLVNKNIEFGELYLLKANNEILSLKDTLNLKQKLNYENQNNIYYKELITFDDKLKFVYIIENNEKNLIILRNSFPLIMIALFIFSIINVVFYLLFLTKKIKVLSNIDPLTSLLNRRAMEEKLNTLINISKRYEQEISFLMLDIDDFKKINDTYGHKTGDETLKAIAKILIDNCRNADLISRYGGEEFLICLSNTELHSAYHLAERIRIDISKLKIKNIDKNITISIGCAQHIYDESIEKTIDRADKLLYEAKVNGKNQTRMGVRF